MVIINLKIKIMETKLEINSLKALKAVIVENIRTLARKSEKEDGWVIAGDGGGSIYAYVGLGCGYMGACLAPWSMSPLVFSSEIEAADYAVPMDYENERLEHIRLKAMSASLYYTILIAELKKSFKAIDSL